MPIRGSINGPKKGYPDIRFEAYRMRFGQIVAEFTNPAMRMLVGEYEKQPTREPPKISFHTKDCVVGMLATRKRRGLSLDLLEEVINNWPKLGDERTLQPSPTAPVVGRFTVSADEEMPSWLTSSSPSPTKTATAPSPSTAP